MDPLGLHTAVHHDHTDVRVVGALDLANVPQVEEHLRELVRAGTHHLVVDLAAVDFCDCVGLSMLISVRKRLRERGGTLRVAGVQPAVARVFHITGLHDAFALSADPGADAQAVCDPHPPAEPAPRPAGPRRHDREQMPEPALAQGPDGTG